MFAGIPQLPSDHAFGDLPPAPTEPAGTNPWVVMLVVVAAIVLMLLACSGILLALLLPAITTTREIVRVEAARNQMKQIGLAMHNYHSTYGQLPPAFTTDPRGEPTNSWRLMLMPFLDEPMRLEQWHLQQPWDSEVNAGLGTPAPGVYTSPLVQNPPTPTETHIFAVRHPDSVMPGADGLNWADISDRLPDTILAAYLPEHTTHWAAPVDISLERLQDELANATQDSPIILLFADGSVRLIDEPLQPELVESLVTRSGHETIGL